MKVNKPEETISLTYEDAEFAKLNRARVMMMKVCQLCELEADEAMNVLANVLVMIAVHECLPRADLVEAVGLMYDARLKEDMQDETFN